MNRRAAGSAKGTSKSDSSERMAPLGHHDRVLALMAGVRADATPVYKSETSTLTGQPPAASPVSPEKAAPFPDAGVVLLDEDYHVRACNLAAADLLQRDAREILGRPWNDVWGRGAGDTSMDLEVSSQRLAAPDGCAGEMLLVLNKPGGRGSSIGATEVIEMLVHDLQTPITVMRGTVSALLSLDRRMSPAQRRNHLRRMERSVQRISRQIENFVESFRFEAGSAELNLQQLLFSGLARTVVAAVKDQLMSKNISVRASSWMPAVCVDKDLMEHVLFNLIANAVTYSNGGPVRVHVVHVKEPEDLPPELRFLKARLETASLPAVLVAVSDKGPGIPDSELPLVFTKFHRGTGPGGGRTVGSGLGLYLTQHILRAHQATFGVHSREGIGSTFFFLLPPVTKSRGRNNVRIM